MAGIAPHYKKGRDCFDLKQKLGQVKERKTLKNKFKSMFEGRFDRNEIFHK